jgi:hypothetical protein
MSQFAISWRLSRGRFIDAIKDLSQAQLNWRLHPDTLTLGEAALHVAGVEASFVSQLLDLELDEFGRRLKAAATEGVVNDQSFPFSSSEITPELVVEALEKTGAMVEPLIDAPTPEILNKELVSALGPVITGEGALARFAFHAGYHQGQAHLIKTAPGFPS